jgi:hypothetical protein
MPRLGALPRLSAEFRAKESPRSELLPLLPFVQSRRLRRVARHSQAPGKEKLQPGRWRPGLGAGESGSVDNASRMARSDVEVVRRATEALNRAAETGELRPMIEEFYDPEFEYHPPPGVPEPGPHRGHDQMEDFYRFFRDQFDRIRITIEDVKETAGRVTYRQSTEVTGKGRCSRRRQLVLRGHGSRRSPGTGRRGL